VHVNLAISGLERLVRISAWPSSGGSGKNCAASQAAIRKLQCELNDTITGIAALD